MPSTTKTRGGMCRRSRRSGPTDRPWAAPSPASGSATYSTTGATSSGNASKWPNCRNEDAMLHAGRGWGEGGRARRGLCHALGVLPTANTARPRPALVAHRAVRVQGGTARRAAGRQPVKHGRRRVQRRERRHRDPTRQARRLSLGRVIQQQLAGQLHRVADLRVVGTVEDRLILRLSTRRGRWAHHPVRLRSIGGRRCNCGQSLSLGRRRRPCSATGRVARAG